ncbi:MAG: DUF2520 domain-containing protein, partial [Moraxellaceae bacterium]
VYHYSTTQRRSLHLAAVIACNFSNYLYSVADGYLTQQGVDFNLLKPLILETAEKIQQHAPKAMQTGPAVRHDLAILAMHQNLLAQQPQSEQSQQRQSQPRQSQHIQQLYALLSEGIMQLHEKT